MIVLIDNYDSFTYNLYQYFMEFTEVKVYRNDKITVNEIEGLNPDGIVISPGPGRPIDAGVSLDIVRKLAGKYPILGICLGHQVIGEAFGGEIVKCHEIFHGKKSKISLDESNLFKGISNEIEVMRYHSLVIDRKTLPKNLNITAETEDGIIMAIEDRSRKIYGLQFHPESIFTVDGKKIIKNFINELQIKITDAIDKLARKEDLTENESMEIMNGIINGETTSSQIGAYLMGLKMKGETVSEIVGAVKALRKNMTKVEIENEYLIDTCGTGGDGGKTFNISTVVAIIAASGGVKVAKHGNRAISSKSGSADVLKALEIKTDYSQEDGSKIINEIGMGFLFAPQYHKALKNVANERRELATRTILNLIGPLVNPAPIRGQLMGIFAGDLVEKVGEVLLELGIERGLVVHGMDGLDEITTTRETKVCEINNGKTKIYYITPEEFNMKRGSLEEIAGGEPKENADIILKILKGEKGPKRDIVVLNAAAALFVGKKVESIIEGVSIAEKLLDEGTAYKKYLQLTRGEI